MIRARHASTVALRHAQTAAGAASIKLSRGERFVGPHDGGVLLGVSKRNRSYLAGIDAVITSNQVMNSTLGLAMDGLQRIQTELIGIKQTFARAQSAGVSERVDFQQNIDQHIEQIDAIAQTTRLGRRSLLNGETTVRGYAQIADDGTITRFDPFVAEQAAGATPSGVLEVRVNRLGLVAMCVGWKMAATCSASTSRWFALRIVAA